MLFIITKRKASKKPGLQGRATWNVYEINLNSDRYSIPVPNLFIPIIRNILLFTQLSKQIFKKKSFHFILEEECHADKASQLIVHNFIAKSRCSYMLDKIYDNVGCIKDNILELGK